MRKLYWVSNSAGLFSHFFQLKYLLAIATKLNRKLILVPYNSVHKVVDNHSGKNKIINFCKIFNFSHINNGNGGEKVSCAPIPRNESKNCFLRVRALFRFNDREVICFGGKVWGATGVVPLKEKSRVMNLPPRLIFADQYQTMYESILTELLEEGKGTVNIEEKMPPFCVIHWR